MSINIAINGFGRIGRNICRALYEYNRDNEFNLVAINDLGNAEINAHLLQYDSTHGRFNAEVKTDNDNIIINNHKVKVYSEKNPENLPWKEDDIDIVFECTGIFKSRDTAGLHLKAGAKKVIISAPADKDIKHVVFGINHESLKNDDDIVSNASCTTNALSMLLKPLNDKIGIVSGIMNTIHSYTNDQVLLDIYHSDLRRARSATQSMIPTKTGATSTLALIMPEFEGKLSGFSTRVPTPNVSMIDMTMVMKRETTKEEIHSILENASNNELKGVLQFNTIPLVSSDFNHNPASSIFDESLTFISEGNLVKICAWYDNEWGFSNRMLDVANSMAEKLKTLVTEEDVETV